MPTNQPPVSQQQIKEWETLIAALERKVALAKELNGEIIGAAGTAVAGAIVHGAAAGKSFMGSIVALANGDKPLTRPEMRQKLREEGFSKEKIAQQFNTVLYKTRQAGRTSLLPNGKIWRGEKK